MVQDLLSYLLHMTLSTVSLLSIPCYQEAVEYDLPKEEKKVVCTYVRKQLIILHLIKYVCMVVYIEEVLTVSANYIYMITYNTI